MSEPLKVMHVLRSREYAIRDQILALISHLPTRLFDTTVTGELDDYTKRRLGQSKAQWVQMSLPTDLGLRSQTRAARRLARLLVTQDTAIVHAHGFQAAFTALMARRQLTNGPAIICSPFGLPGLARHSGVQHRSVLTAARWVLRKADLVVVQSEHEADQLRELMRGPLPNLRQVREGVVLERLREDFEPGAKRRLVGLDPMAAIVGVTVPPGGRCTMPILEAARDVVAPRPNVEFVLIGDDAKHPRFAQVAHELGLSGCTVCLGNRADIVEIIASLNVLVIPADYVGARHHAVHALLNGIPLIVGRDGDLPELVQGLSQASVVTCDDAENVNTAIARFLDAVPTDNDGHLVDDELGFSDRELLVSGLMIDLDAFGLEPVPRRPLDAEQAAVQKIIERYSMEATGRTYGQLYNDAVATRQQSIKHRG